MPLPSNDIITMMKDAAWHAELSGDETGMRDYIERKYPHASPYQRRRALELATQAIGVGLALRTLGPDTPLKVALRDARAPAPEVGVRVRLTTGHLGTRPGFKTSAPEYLTFYIPMRWDQTIREVMGAIREFMAVRGYTEAEIQPIDYEFVGPTLFPIT
jgi:hypothetical protein